MKSLQKHFDQLAPHTVPAASNAVDIAQPISQKYYENQAQTSSVDLTLTWLSVLRDCGGARSQWLLDESKSPRWRLAAPTVDA